MLFRSLILKKNITPLHKWIKDDYPETEISDELGFFEGKTSQKELNDKFCSKCNNSDDVTLEEIKELLDQGAEINYIDNNGWAAIHYASYKLNYEVVQYLIEKGANLNILDKYDDTALININKKHFFSIYDIGYEGKMFYNTIKLLILNGCDITLGDLNGCLYYNKNLWKIYEIQKLILCKNIHWLSILKKCDIPLHEYIKEEYPEEVIGDELGFFESNELEWNIIKETKNCNLHNVSQILELSPQDINCVDVNRNTPLHWAIDCNDDKMVKLLLKYKPDIHYQNEKGLTPFMLSVHNDDLEISKLLSPYIDETDFNLVDKYGDNVFHHSVMNKSKLEMLKYLISFGYNDSIDNKNKDGRTPLYYAVNNDSIEICELLLQKGVDINVEMPSYDTKSLLSVSSTDKMMNFLFKNGIDPFIDPDVFSEKQRYFNSYEFQKWFLQTYPTKITQLKKYIKLHPEIEKEFPEEYIGDELGFF